MILLVEDNPDDVKLAKRVFKQHNYNCEIVVARDGVDAIAFLLAQGEYSDRNKNLQPSLVILDVKLPRLDGLQVLKEIRNNAATRLLPVVMFSTSIEESDILESYRLGANSYIRKPIEYEQFSQVIAIIIDYWLIHNVNPHFR